MNVPNILTAIRFVLIPALGYYLFKQDYIIAVTIFLLGGLTDVLDGYIARKYNMVTTWGKLADPLADKLMQITALVILTMQNIVPVFAIAIVIAKEVFMALGSILLYKKDKSVISANWYGKLATVMFHLAIIVIIFNETVGKVLIWFAVLVTLFAFVMYSMSYKKIRTEGK